jgi:hypothetical protein
MPGVRRISLLALVVAGLAAGCGSDDEALPEPTAERMLSQVEGIQEDVEAGNCELVTAQAEQFATEVQNLPGDVEDDVRSGLEQAASRLVDLAREPGQCEEPETGATGATGVEPPPEVETTTAETTTATETEASEETDSDDEQTDDAEDDGETSGPGGGGRPTQIPGGGAPAQTGGVAGGGAGGGGP